MNNLPFLGRTALVTGGTRGIGSAIALRLRNAGAKVIITGTKEKKIDQHYYAVDFSDLSAAKLFAREIGSLDIDILVNNAGINKIDLFSNISLIDFENIQNVNVTAPFLLCQAVLPNMRRKKWGRIVNVSSIFGKITKEMRTSYATSKWALAGMSSTLAVEVARENILVNCVAPGFIDTELTRSVLGEQGMKSLAEQVPMRRMGTAEEVAAFVEWLVSSENTFLTGQNIAIDGGFTCV